MRQLTTSILITFSIACATGCTSPGLATYRPEIIDQRTQVLAEAGGRDLQALMRGQPYVLTSEEARAMLIVMRAGWQAREAWRVLLRETGK